MIYFVFGAKMIFHYLLSTLIRFLGFMFKFKIKFKIEMYISIYSEADHFLLSSSVVKAMDVRVRRYFPWEVLSGG